MQSSTATDGPARLIEPRHAAAILGVSVVQVRQLRHEGRLPAAYEGRRVTLYDLADVERLAAQRAASAKAL